VKLLFALPYVPSVIRVRPYQFLRELTRRHEVVVLASAARREFEDAPALAALGVRVELVPRTAVASARSCAAGALAGLPLQAAIGRSPALQQRLRRLLAAERFDLVHVEHLRAAHLAEAIPPSLPTVYDAVDCISLLLERTRQASHSARQRWLARLELARTRAYEAALVRRFNRVVATSADDADALAALAGGLPVEVVPNGVDLDRFRPLEQPADGNTLVFSGKMSYHANVTAVQYLVREIFPRIQGRHPSARLRIVGSAPPPEVRALAGNPAITVTGYVGDLRAAFVGATVAACPMVVKVGIQNKVLEAMAMQVPVVANSLAARGLQAVAGRDYLLGDDPDAFARQVVRLLEEPRLRSSVGRAGRGYVEAQHQWSVLASELERHYAAAMASHPSPSPRAAVPPSAGGS
jgi:glycosyltransferase involved in cell wall biosynthesis